ncbi:unnamed protein product [Closterium sp. NIES-65]|nr:unnamed protein product [Closterium sp. NIES-65]
MASANCTVAASSLHLSCSARQSALTSLASPSPSAHPAAIAAISSLAASRRTAFLPAPALTAPRQHCPTRARRAVRVMASQSEKRALISVSDKTGLDTLAKGLLDLGFTLVSTGGTAKAIEEAGLPVTTVDQITNFPEMLDGRVKTLHPAVHGGILARRGLPAHMDALAAHNIGPIDVVAVNLYPFVATVTAQGGASLEKGIENIDIGGPTMIRAAAKNHENVWVVVDPADYASLLAALKEGKGKDEGESEEALRRRLAWKAFQHTASYDAAVSEWLWPHAQPKTDEFAPPPALAVPLSLSAVLRYGENPHQRAAFYADDSLGERGKGGIGTAVQHHGKNCTLHPLLPFMTHPSSLNHHPPSTPFFPLFQEMSYNNYLDADAAWQCVWEMPTAACVVVKHTNPCGAATVTLPPSASPEEQEAALLEAYRAAVRADPVSAFGGIVAFNRPVTAALARELREFRSPTDGETRMFYEIVVAPGYTEEGLAVLKGKSKALRILQAQASSTGRRSLRQVGGGWLLQDSDDVDADDLTLTVVTKKQPSEADLENARFAWRVVKHVKSNAITIAKVCLPSSPTLFPVLTFGSHPLALASLLALTSFFAVLHVHLSTLSAASSLTHKPSCHPSLPCSLLASFPFQDGRLLGMGSGQPNRVKSGQIALEKAGDEAKGAAVASDAFFPFAWGDAVEAACEAGVSVIIQPGGSVRDQDAIDCCDKYGVAMVFTNVRHFRH